MGRPRGSKKRKSDEESSPIVEAPKVEEKAIKSSKPEKLPVLGPDEQYFEAPDGTVLVGPATQGRIWYRKGEIWINPRRI